MGVASIDQIGQLDMDGLVKASVCRSIGKLLPLSSAACRVCLIGNGVEIREFTKVDARQSHQALSRPPEQPAGASMLGVRYWGECAPHLMRHV